jgi:hypothetical protein
MVSSFQGVQIATEPIHGIRLRRVVTTCI